MKPVKTEFLAFTERLAEHEKLQIKEFFNKFDLNFLLNKNDIKKFRLDFEKAIIYLYNNGVSIREILSRLSLSNLAGFYARPSIIWFPLDDAAKIYPVSMEHGQQQIFRISMYLKEQVHPELLQVALHFTIKRFPSFAATLKKGFFWHYLDGSKRHFSIKEETSYPCKPMKISRTGSMSIRIIYYNNRISAEFFHVVTDGTGATTFLKALVKEYLRLNGVESEYGDIWNINDTPVLEEFENAFKKVEKAKHSSGFIGKSAVQLGGRMARKRPCRLLHFKMDAEKLHQVAKSNDASISSYLLALLFYACRSATDLLDGDINIQVPVNMRKYYPSKTMGNFSMYCGIRIPIEQIGDKKSLISEISTQLAEKSAKEKMHEMITSAVNIVSSIRYIPLAVKQPIAKMIFGFLGEKVYTTTFSNLGVVKVPEQLAKHIDSMDFCLGAHVTNRLVSTAITINNTTTLTISKMTNDPAFEEKLYQLLTDDGIAVSVEGSDYYER